MKDKKINKGNRTRALFRRVGRNLNSPLKIIHPSSFIPHPFLKTSRRADIALVAGLPGFHCTGPGDHEFQYIRDKPCICKPFLTRMKREMGRRRGRPFVSDTTGNVPGGFGDALFEIHETDSKTLTEFDLRMFFAEIDDAHHGGVNGRTRALSGCRGGGPAFLYHHHHIAHPGIDGVKRHERTAD